MVDEMPISGAAKNRATDRLMRLPEDALPMRLADEGPHIPRACLIL